NRRTLGRFGSCPRLLRVCGTFGSCADILGVGGTDPAQLFSGCWFYDRNSISVAIYPSAAINFVVPTIVVKQRGQLWSLWHNQTLLSQQLELDTCWKHIARYA